MDYDIAIIGLGPTGAVAAALLGDAGWRVLVVDKARAVYDKPRAMALDHEVMRVLQQLGVADQVLPHTEPFTASEHFGADGQLIRRLDMLPPPYPLGWIPSMVFLQPPVEQILRDHVAAIPTVTLALGQELTGLAQDEAGVSLQLRGDDGTTRTAQARYVIGCDGASSTVRRLCGLALDDLGFDEPWLVVDLLANAQGLAKLPAHSAQFCEPERPISYLVGAGAHRRWEIMLLPGEDPQAMATPAHVWPLLARWLSPDDGQLWRQASYRFHALVAPQWRQGRVLLAGDAAHQQPPFLGQGMCQGVRDAANVAWKLTQVLRGNTSDAAKQALLDSYGAERGGHVRALTTTIKGIGRYICERDPVAAAARDAKLRADAGGVVKSVPRQDLMPPLPATAPQAFFSSVAHPALGTLFPQPTVQIDGQAPQLMDDVLGCGWRVVLGDEAKDWVVNHPASWRVWATDALRKWFNRHQCHAAIVRPDHYVYGVATDRNSLQAQINTLVTLNQQETT